MSTFSFKPITQLKLQILAQPNSHADIRKQLANYKQRWNESVADNIQIISSLDDHIADIPLIAPSYLDDLPEHTHTINSIGQLAHYDLRRCCIETSYRSTDDLATALNWLDNAPDTVALDFETAPYLTKEEQKSLSEQPDLTHEQKLSTMVTGLFPPAVVLTTHLSVSIKESESFVIILTDTTRQPVYDWIVSTTRKQVWHNATFDLKHVMYNTGKYPIDVEDSLLMWKTILNSINKQSALSGLKHLAGPIYSSWSVGADLFGLEHQYNDRLLEYAAIDSMATLYLYHEALLHEDFKLTTPIDTLDNLLPIRHPKEFNPGRRYFYESVIKPMLEPIIQVSLNGINLDLDKVQGLADKFDKIMADAVDNLHTSKYVQDTLTFINHAKIAKYTNDRLAKLRDYTHFLKPFDYKKIDHRSYLVEALLAEQGVTSSSTDLLPNGKPKWSINAIKSLISTTESENVKRILVMMNDVVLHHDSTVVKQAMYNLALDKRNSNANQIKYDIQLKTPEEFAALTIKFNPNSTPSTQVLFELMEITPIEFTDCGAPSWGRAQLEELLETIEEEAKLFVIRELLNISEVSTTRSNFVENFLKYNIDGRIHGTHTLFGTLSFRPSSGKGTEKKVTGHINLLNQPSTGSPAAKVIKECMTAPKGKILLDIDLASLEDRVLGNIADSKAKQNLIFEKLDGHCYHSYLYDKEKVEDIVGKFDNDVDGIKAYMKAVYDKVPAAKNLRQASKSKTFKLSYLGYPDAHKGGTLTQEVFDIYHTELYPEITQYREGYVLPTAIRNQELHLLLGAAVRTDNPKRDIRSLFNSTIQSFSIITLIALVQIHYKIKEAGYEGRILITNTIYDACYFELDDDPELIKWLNDQIVPLITQRYLDPEVIPNAADSAIGYDLYNTIEIPNYASIDDIETAIQKLKER